MMRTLDLFSAAAGGWSLGLHRAGFVIGRAILRTEAALDAVLLRATRDIPGDQP